MITVELLNAEKVAAAFAQMPELVLQALASKMRVVAMNLAHYVRTQKLQGQVLHQRSGQLNRSIQSEATQDGNKVIGKVFSAGDVKYAAIHEYGGNIPAQTIVARKAKALAFIVDGKTVFAKSVSIPARTMPERSFLRSSLRENEQKITKELEQAAVLAARQVMGE